MLIFLGPLRGPSRASALLQNGIGMKVTDMKCPSCTDVELVRDTRDLPYNHQGKATVIPSVTGLPDLLGRHSGCRRVRAGEHIDDRVQSMAEKSQAIKNP
jgi:hypothetical protein